MNVPMNECHFQWDSKSGETWTGGDLPLRGLHRCIRPEKHDDEHKCCCGNTIGGGA
ncbi:MAG: hypothetical protein ABFE07_09725 [Armatimonadia bacterium]